ncbi:hypothetical protein LNI98_07000 [Tenacibaculum dicentrarchi]|uniref:hypothetical protein n=1 Tax=Tenacibaculum dicentrarchi TaxID=669041 RepID=UPI001E578138|nr:hypothetical protein [Tenacibaculum dicentrarchi]MDB0603325.1 hypothetical protein [Tenacibaculum maritimum]
MKKEVQRLLSLTPSQYNRMIFNVWFEWCNQKTTTSKELQKALICKPLFNWWQKELLNLEALFLKEIAPFYKIVSKDVAQDIYDSYTSEIFKKLSKSTIKKANL